MIVKGTLLKWLIGDFLFDQLMGPVFAGLRRIFSPLIEAFSKKAGGKIAERAAQKFADEFFTLLGETDIDEERLADAFLERDDYNELEAFSNKLEMIGNWFAPHDSKRADEMREYFRRLVIQKDVEQTGRMISFFAAMPEDTFKKYLRSIDIEHKDLRSKYKFLVGLQESFKKGGKYGFKYFRRATRRYWHGLFMPIWTMLKARVQKVVIAVLAVFTVLIIMAVAAYAARWPGALVAFLLAMSAALAFLESVWLKVYWFVISLPARLSTQETVDDLPDLNELMARNEYPPLVRGFRLVFMLIAHFLVIVLLRPDWAWTYVFWGYLTLFLVLSSMWIKAYPSPQFMAAKVIFTMTFLFVGFVGSVRVFPAQAKSAELSYQRYMSTWNQQNIVDELNNNPELVATESALGWQFDRDEFGTPVLDASGFVAVQPCMVNIKGEQVQFRLSKGDRFKILGDGVTVNAGEPLVQVYVPNQDGSWIQGPSSPKCWVPVAKTGLAIPKSQSQNPSALVWVKPDSAPQPAPTQETAPTPKTDDIKAIQASVESVTGTQPSAAKKQFLVNATAVYASGIWVTKGQTIVVKASGKVNSLPEAKNYDATYRWVGPDGWGQKSPGYITEGGKSLAGPLPAGSSYLALAARVATSQPSLVDGKWLMVGSSKTFTAEQDGYLYFVLNEVLQENGYSRLEYLTNNQGGFQVEVKVQ